MYARYMYLRMCAHHMTAILIERIKNEFIHSLHKQKASRAHCIGHKNCWLTLEFVFVFHSFLTGERCILRMCCAQWFFSPFFLSTFVILFALSLECVHLSHSNVLNVHTKLHTKYAYVDAYKESSWEPLLSTFYVTHLAIEVN